VTLLGDPRDPIDEIVRLGNFARSHVCIAGLRLADSFLLKLLLLVYFDHRTSLHRTRLHSSDTFSYGLGNAVDELADRLLEIELIAGVTFVEEASRSN